MTRFVQTTEKSFVRDLATGGLLNTDNDALRVYKARRAKHLSHENNERRVQVLEQKVEELTAIIERLGKV